MQYLPDRTILSSDILYKHTFEVLDYVGSNHRPIFTTVFPAMKRSFNRKTKWNFKKVNWELYRKITDQLISELGNFTTADNLCELITSSIKNAAEKSIPQGCRKVYKPFWNKYIENAVRGRETARTTLGNNPNMDNKILYNKACAQVKLIVKTANKT